MRRGVVSLVCMLVALGLVYAAAEKAMMKTHDLDVEVVSVDVDGKMITVKDDKGEEHKAPVTGSAIASLPHLKPGEKVVVTCEDDEKGNHKAVVKIMPKKASS